MGDVSQEISGSATDPTPFVGTQNLLAENDCALVLTNGMPGPELIQVLPESFRSMIGESIDTDTCRVPELIRLLGEKLGIEDYRENLASFWLLDVMALEVMRNRQKMDSVNLAVLISWIAGEAKLIEESRFTRTEFFQKMASTFFQVSEKISKGRRIIYWEEICGIEFSENQDQEKRRLNDSGDWAEGENFEIEKNRGRSDSLNLNASRKTDTVIASSMDVLEAIIESTYAIFGNAFHYDTVSAAFAKPVELHSYRLPYTLRLPRPVQKTTPPSLNEPTSTVARKKASMKTDKGITGKVKGRENSKSKAPAEIIPQSPSITDQEMTAQKRSHILPLMESNEAPHLLEQFAQPQINDLIVETKSEKKTKQKAR